MAIKVSFDGYPEPTWEHATTDSSGHYQLVRYMHIRATLQAQFVDESGAIPPAKSEERKVAVLRYVDISISSLTYDPWGELIVSGSYHDPYDEGYWDTALRLEYSLDGKSGWKLAKNLDGRQGRFSKKFSWSRSGYWRVRLLEDSDHQESVSQVRKAWRWATYFSKYKVKPKKVRKNAKVKVSGKLNRWYSMDRKGAYKYQKVLIIFRFKKGKKWYLAGKAKTNSKGKFSKRVRAYGDSYFVALFEGGKNTFATDSKKIYVNTYGSGRGIAAQPSGLIPWLKTLPSGTGHFPARIG